MRIKRTKRYAEKTPWFRYRPNRPYKGQLRLKQQSRDPQYASGSGYDHQEEEETKEGSNSGDHELVDPSSSEKQVSNEFEESCGDQETGVEGDEEKEEGFGDVKAPEYQDPSSFYHSLEKDNGYDNSSDDREQNKRCRTQPEMSPECSESEREMGTMKQENDYEYYYGLDRLKVWMDRMGLGEYVPLFKLHKVDDDVLQFLTVEDLKAMGVPQLKLDRAGRSTGTSRSSVYSFLEFLLQDC